MLTVTALYAGLAGLLWIGIAAHAGRLRGQTGISIGHGGNAELHLAMRRHANFVESAPLALLLIGVLELNGVSATALHALGAALIAFRIAHAFGIKADTVSSPARGIGAGGTTLVIAVGSLWAIWTSLGG